MAPSGPFWPFLPLKSLIAAGETFFGVTALFFSCAGPTLFGGILMAAYAPTFSARKSASVAITLA